MAGYILLPVMYISLHCTMVRWGRATGRYVTPPAHPLGPTMRQDTVNLVPYPAQLLKDERVQLFLVQLKDFSNFSLPNKDPTARW